ncbi:MAG TPA: glycosyltransferase [Paludibacteraceae bacterium]|nr:glycosyltransferase [Paludibacteraceae bacterium]
MKRILILCDAFGPPSFTPRIRFLCHYLVENGWNIQLCTEKFAPITFAHSYPINEIELYHHRGLVGKLEWVIKSTLSLILDYKNKQFSKQVRKHFTDDSFDLVLCSTFHTFPLRAAFEIAHKQKIPLVVDLRDIVEQAPGNQYHAHKFNFLKPVAYWFKKINVKRRNSMIQKAQALISVSPWHVDFLKTYNPATHLIYNGFDADVFYPNQLKTEKFILSYTGKLYEQSMQDPELFFVALSELTTENSKFKKDCEVHWYTNQDGENKLKNLTSQYQLDESMIFHSYVSIDNIPQILQKSSIVLVFSNKATSNGSNGIMTTKFFEALGVEKPILCVRSDEGCLSAAIKETNAGLAGTTVEEVKAFIVEKYEEWKKTGYTHQPVDQNKKMTFSRQAQAQQFENIFEQLILLKS